MCVVDYFSSFTWSISPCKKSKLSHMKSPLDCITISCKLTAAFQTTKLDTFLIWVN